MEVKIDYTPRKWAKGFHSSDKRWRILVLHRRAGKSTSCINQLIKDALLNKNSRYAYIGPTYKQTKLVIWDMLKYYSRPIPGMKYNESELRADFPNGGRISLYGAENADSLRGIALWGCVFDEYAQQPRSIFTEVVSKCLADHLGYATFIGTPKGRNQFFELFELAKSTEDWFWHMQDIDKTLAEEKGETVDNLRQALEDDRKLVAQGIMDEDEFMQEWYVSFDAAIKGAYYAKLVAIAKENGRVCSVPYDENLPVETYWDLGMNDATAIGFFQVYRGEWRMIDYYENSGESLHHYAGVLQARGYLYGTHYFPHDAVVRELSTGKSRLEIAKKIGIRPIKIVPRLPIDDGINAVRMNFSKIWFDKDKCADFLDKVALYRKEYDEKRGIFKSRPVHDFTSHANDVLRYWAISQKGLLREEEKKVITESDIFDRFSVI